MLSTLSKTERTIISGPDTISRGFVYAKDSEELLNEVNRLVTSTINELQEVTCISMECHETKYQKIGWTIYIFLYKKKTDDSTDYN